MTHSLYRLRGRAAPGYRPARRGRARVIKRRAAGRAGSIIIFNDASGRPLDLDLRGTERRNRRAASARRSRRPPATEAAADGAARPRPAQTRRGRARGDAVAAALGLAGTQPGGASVALRKLVDEARRTSGDRDRPRAAQRRGLSLHVGHGRQSRRFRGSFARSVRRRPATLCRTDRRLADDVRDHIVKLAFSDRPRDFSAIDG